MGVGWTGAGGQGPALWVVGEWICELGGPGASSVGCLGRVEVVRGSTSGQCFLGLEPRGGDLVT